MSTIRNGRVREREKVTWNMATMGRIHEDECREGEQVLDKTFGYQRNFESIYELGKEIRRGHFGHTY